MLFTNVLQALMATPDSKTGMESGGNLSYLFFFPSLSILACLFLENRQLHAIGYTHSPCNSVKTA